MNKENSNQVRLGKHFFTDFINSNDNNFVDFIFDMKISVPKQ